jgi:two-component system, OmpR family, phosphate regulon sensor histidine kinase PhoR
VHELGSCITEADIIQVLYRGLEPLFGYNVVLLQVLEREGWYHSVAIDSGVVQDLRRRPLSGSIWADHYTNPSPRVVKATDAKHLETGKGPGGTRMPKFAIWVPVEHQGEVIGSVAYQSYRNRRVPAAEMAFLDEVHRRLGVLIANASLNELTRNQARRLGALNSIARAMASTLDEVSVLAGLHTTLSELLPVDVLEMVSLSQDHAGKARLLHVEADLAPTSRWISNRTAPAASAQAMVRNPKPLLIHEPSSSLWVPIKEGGVVRGALGIKCARPYVYEASTAAFLELVSDEVTLALRNARSYEAIEDQRRQLEVVNAIGRRLASSLDRWSIMRTLREELAAFLAFDGFILATITESDEGPIAEGYQYVAGVEEVVPPVALAVTGPSREAYETGRPVLVRHSPWARSFERKGLERERWNVGRGAAVFVSGAPGKHRDVSRSFVWVPVLSGDRITAMLSLQSYHDAAFDDWHVRLLQDVAAHVSLALANADHFAQAQAERARLEALHVLEMGVAGASDESQIADAVFAAVTDYTDAAHMVLAYLDAAGNVVGFNGDRGGQAIPFGPTPIEDEPSFRRLIEGAGSVFESVPEVEEDTAAPVNGSGPSAPSHVVWVPVTQGERVVAGISAQRDDGGLFPPSHLKLLEAAAPVVGIALRTMRLHHANELALAQSVRIQELAALAGHELMSVVSNIADQALTMLECAGVVCWAFDTEGRTSATRGSGDPAAEGVLAWAGLVSEDNWRDAPTGMVTGVEREQAWSLIPLWYGDRLVGAIGSVHASIHLAEPGSAALDFARHAAVAIENSRLVAETRGRIRTLEAVAAFTELTPTEPERARSEMARIVSRALANSQGELWLLEDGNLVRRGAGDADSEPRVPVADSSGLLKALNSAAGGRRLRALLDLIGASPDAFAIPIQVEGRLAGLLVARMTAGASETRRLAAVLAGQASVLIGQLELVDALDRERRMMNAILRHSPVGVMLEDAAGSIVYANPEVESIYNLQASEMPGRKPAEIYAAAGAVASDEGETDDTLELHMRDPDRIVRVRRVVIPGIEGEPAGILTLHEDVTAQRLALEAKDLMLRAIGHEVRSPAAAMKNTLAGIMQWDATIDAGGRRELLQEAYESSDRLLSLVESQLIIAKLETRHFEPSPERVDLGPALDGVMAVLHHRYAERASAVEVSLPDNLPPAACEPTHLAQVLTNLIGNALEYTGKAVMVQARVAPRGWLEITVTDHGPGLPAPSLETLFEKTGPAGRNRSQGGLGLGLYLCRLVVERSFGGRIWVASSDRNGTIFKFIVPAIDVSIKGRTQEPAGTAR